MKKKQCPRCKAKRVVREKILGWLDKIIAGEDTHRLLCNKCGWWQSFTPKAQQEKKHRERVGATRSIEREIMAGFRCED